MDNYIAGLLKTDDHTGDVIDNTPDEIKEAGQLANEIYNDQISEGESDGASGLNMYRFLFDLLHMGQPSVAEDFFLFLEAILKKAQDEPDFLPGLGRANRDVTFDMVCRLKEFFEDIMGSNPFWYEMYYFTLTFNPAQADVERMRDWYTRGENGEGTPAMVAFYDQDNDIAKEFARYRASTEKKIDALEEQIRLFKEKAPAGRVVRKNRLSKAS